MKAKKQHWVPQLYLRPFSTQGTIQKPKNKRQIHVQSVEDPGHFFLSNIGDIAAENHLYTPIDPETGERNWDIDDHLGEYEKMIGKLWPVFLEADLPLSGPQTSKYNFPHGDDLRKAVTMFISQLQVRNSHNRAKIEKIVKQHALEINKIPKDASGNSIPFTVKYSTGRTVDMEVTAEELEKVKRADSSMIEGIFLNTIEAPRGDLNKIIYDKTWRVIVSAEKQFLTCDRPVVVQDESVGMGNSTIYFPLSPNRCLVMIENGSGEEGYFVADDQSVVLINWLVLRHAAKFIYSQSDSEDSMRDLDEFCKNNPDAMEAIIKTS